jgi:hypothetical protein
MDLIMKCETIAELTALENENSLTELERRALFTRKLEIFNRIGQWRLENERLGILPDLTDTWTPEQRDNFLRDWQDDENVTQGEKRSYDEIDDEPQIGYGQDDDGFHLQSTRQVNVKKFNTTSMDYHVQFTNSFADMELSQYHGRLHEMFQNLLDQIIGGASCHNQVRFLLRWRLSCSL